MTPWDELENDEVRARERRRLSQALVAQRKWARKEGIEILTIDDGHEHEFVPWCPMCGHECFYETLCGSCGDIGEYRQCLNCGLDEVDYDRGS